jgi:hypothetical protein
VLVPLLVRTTVQVRLFSVRGDLMLLSWECVLAASGVWEWVRVVGVVSRVSAVGLVFR